MKALIFNSGVGNRMGEFTRDNHKSMATLSNGETIFGRQLRLLVAEGISEVVVTTGPHVEQLRAVADDPRFGDLVVTFVPNDRYLETNYIYSMYLARGHLDSDVIMLHGDLVFTAGALRAILADERTDLGAVNASLPLPEKDFKARIRNDAIVEVSVAIDGPDCVAFQPMYKLSREVLAAWLARVDDYVAAGTTSVYAENALNEIAEGLAIRPFSYDGHLVAEVDTLDDLASVSAEVRVLDAAEQTVLTGEGAAQALIAELNRRGVRRLLVVAGTAFHQSVIRRALDEASVGYVTFAGYSPNPRQEEVAAGVTEYRAQGCDAILAVGGGSAMDVAKCVALLVSSEGTGYPEWGEPLAARVPLFAAPTTAGTGSESTHFAVVYIDGVKHSIAHDAILPDLVVLEPELLRALPEYHKKASLLDALAQCVESVWALSATPRSRAYAVEGIRLILANFFPYFHKSGRFDAKAANAMQQAANLSGRAINLTKTTAAHAMSYGLTTTFGLAHGHAAVLSLRGVWRQYIAAARSSADDEATERLRGALDVLASAFAVKTWEEAPEKLDIMLSALALPDPVDVDLLVAGVNLERLGNSPIRSSEADLRRSYDFALGLRQSPVIGGGKNRKPAGVDLITPRELPELQAVELGILKAFDAYCEEQGLRYYLSEGSMLGAVRHGGMIPWDDDIDVMMPRAEFDRLAALARDGKLPEGFNLDCFQTNPRHWVLGAKFQMTAPSRFVQPQVSHLATHCGPHIDIFTVDDVRRPHGWKFRTQAYALRGLRRALFMSSGRSRGLRKNLLARVPIFIVTKLLPTRAFHNLIVYLQAGFNSGPGSEHQANLCSYYPLEREVFPTEWFGDGRRVDFDGVSTVIPDRAEDMLAKIYGLNYAGIPQPSVGRQRRHSFYVRSEAVGSETTSRRVKEC
ncbi:hypothetical protein BW730_00195 [Tessaracoccus aquimaris]|uniref:Alcohol dehydrogenase iron-type/glycerol dehydrogenase GldA domain-containing protein n=1 Tax=Tessaracoccus aquimaris TaxID=1332264 RepID=A0A1Q2CJB5_9ACTN|nr:iron-containing alcohol dehydrogenase [Tessaracoccus aquimaris]AQP46228.1 hypothetical protein BW730_00195 [Tessaracoccus aquimaris]